MAANRNGLAVQDSAAVLARLRQAEVALSSELAALRQAIAELAAVLETPTVATSLLTVVEAPVSFGWRGRGSFNCWHPGPGRGTDRQARCVPRRSIDAYLERLGWHDQGRQQSVLHL
jgi:hypothetical protein